MKNLKLKKIKVDKIPDFENFLNPTLQAMRDLKYEGKDKCTKKDIDSEIAGNIGIIINQKIEADLFKTRDFLKAKGLIFPIDKSWSLTPAGEKSSIVLECQ